MKILILLTFLLSCSVKPYIQKFEQSNEFFLERTINRINLNTLHPFLKKSDRIIVSSIEMPDFNDNPVLAVVEDRIIEKLTSSGFKVYERDPDMINSLLKEMGNEFSFKAGKQPKKHEKPLIDTKLPSATKIVSYRIEEFGYKFRPHQENRNLKVREGLARLHFRVTDAKSSTLLSAQTVDVLFHDNVPEEFLNMSDKIVYKPYTHKYPVLFRDSIKTDEIEPLEPERVSAFEGLKWYAEPQLVFRTGAGSGFGIRYGLADNIKRFLGHLYYSTAEKNHYSFSINYDRVYNLPSAFNLNTLKLATRVGTGYTNNKIESGFIMQFGAGFEYKIYGLNVHMGWNHGLPFIDSDGLWSTDYVISINFLQ